MFCLETLLIIHCWIAIFSRAVERHQVFVKWQYLDGVMPAEIAFWEMGQAVVLWALLAQYFCSILFVSLIFGQNKA